VEVDTDLAEGTSIDDIRGTMPESAPRYIAYRYSSRSFTFTSLLLTVSRQLSSISYKYTHDDGRVSLPLVFIFYCPRDINPTLAMLYTSTKTKLINALQIQKVRLSLVALI
jgi:hypothetical protein